MRKYATAFVVFSVLSVSRVTIGAESFADHCDYRVTSISIGSEGTIRYKTEGSVEKVYTIRKSDNSAMLASLLTASSPTSKMNLCHNPDKNGEVTALSLEENRLRSAESKDEKEQRELDNGLRRFESILPPLR